MIKKIHIGINYKTEDEYTYILSRFSNNMFDIKKIPNHRAFNVFFPEGLPTGNELRQYAMEHKMYSFEERLINYNEEELEKIPYYVLRLGNPSIPGILNCYDAGAEYEYSRCAYCQSGALQLKPMQLPIKRLTSYDIFRITPEVVISERVKKAFDVNQITGIKYMDVLNKKTKQVDSSFFQLNIISTLPKNKNKDYVRLVERCPKCGLISYSFSSPRCYNLSDFSADFDFYLTKESLYCRNTIGKNLGYQCFDMIVSKRIVRILQDFNMINVGFKPIHFPELY